MRDTAGRPLVGSLQYIELTSGSPEGLAQFYAELFEMPLDACGEKWICRSAERTLVFASGPSRALSVAGYRVRDAAVLLPIQDRLRRAGYDADFLDDDVFGGKALHVVDPDGNRIRFCAEPVSNQPHPMSGPSGRLQHLVVGSQSASEIVEFYSSIVGFRISDLVLGSDYSLRTCFMRSDDEHHSFAVFQTSKKGLDHHCYEVRSWNDIRDWGDRLARRRIPVKWGPGRHGPGNNLFLFFHDPDGNWVEISSELERVPIERPAGIWPHEERTLNQWGQGLLRS